MSNESTNIKTATSEFRTNLVIELRALDRMARKHTKDPIEAQELLQDTFVLALRFSDTYKKGTNLRAWLLRIMRNRHISQIRRKSLEKRVFQAEVGGALIEWSVGQASLNSAKNRCASYDREHLLDNIWTAMKELKPEFREAVLMCDVHGLSYAEAAKRAGRPIGTIMSRIHRGRRALSRRLGARQHLKAA